MTPYPEATLEASPEPSRDLRVDKPSDERTLARPALKLDLRQELETLKLEAGWREHGHSAKTLVKHRGFRVVLIAMKEGARMKEHKSAGAVTIQCIAGCLTLGVGNQAVELSDATMLALDRGISHDVGALTDCAFLLTVEAISHG